MTKNYKLSEAADYLGVYPKTLQKWDYAGKLIAHRTKTNRRYYTQEQLDNWLNKKKATAKQKIGQIGMIYITYKDRFIRFGFDWFKPFCQDHDCQIVVLNNPDTSPEEEITEDLLSIIHVFSCRSYGLRKYKKQIKKLVEKKENEN